MKRLCSILALALMWAGSSAELLPAQGVTTASLAGFVRRADGTPVQDARVTAIHEPSGTTYQGLTRSDGRYAIPGMRVGGPYTVSARALGAAPKTQGNVFLTLGVTTDVSLQLQEAVVALGEVMVTAETGTMSSNRTGAATTVGAEALETLPTIGRNISDFTRLTPQAAGTSFAGADNRMNNITIDGSFFNNSFGLSGQPGGRTNVSPIPLDAVDQVQVAIAPFDVRQGNFVGAGVNAVTKSGTNNVEGSVYYIGRDQSYVGRKAGALNFDPGKFNFAQFGGRIGGPILRNKLFFFVNYENDARTQPGTTFLANPGGQQVAGNMTRVLASDLDRVSNALRQSFNYETGPYQGFSHETPSQRLIAKLDFNANAANKVSLRYIHLDSRTDNPISNSSSLGAGNRRDNANSMSFANSGYGQLENIRSLVGEWNAQFGSRLSNNMIVGYTKNDESREYKGSIFPTIDIREGGRNYITAGFDPFTPNNELRYSTFQAQNNLTLSTTNHDITFGGSIQQYESENVFFSGSQSVYVYNSLADFFTDINDYVANPARTTSPVTLNRFQVRYNNIPGQEKPVQPLEVLYAGLYLQDVWRATPRLNLTMGLRVDAPYFGKTALRNTAVDAMTFRDETGATVKYATDKLPDPNMLFSPRFGFNWDVRGDRSLQLRGGSGVFTGSPAYVWISNQIGENGILTGFQDISNTTTRPFNPNPNTYKPTTVTGAPAPSYALAFTDPEFRFPQVWRTNLAVDHRLPFDVIGTAEFLYGQEVNGIYYINANLPAPTTTFAGPDTRPRWTGNRINANISNAIVMKNQSMGRSYSVSGSLEKDFLNGFFAKAAYSYGVAKNTVDPGSIASGTWTSNPHSGDPNNPGLGYSSNSPGHRAFLALSRRFEYARLGATTFSIFSEARTQGNASYIYTSDINGDGATNDLIYVARDQSEMNFQPYTTAGGTLFTAAQQAAAWDAYIAQDPYLSTRRGKYAERNAAFMPMVFRTDMSVTQEVFRGFVGKQNSLQLRLDVLNFGNLLNRNWGTGKRFTDLRPLVPAGFDATGRPRFQLASSGDKLPTTTFQPTSSQFDVYQLQLGLRYTFK